MRCWVVVVSAERFAGERLYALDALTVPLDNPGRPGDVPASGDVVACAVAGEPALLFGLGQVRVPRDRKDSHPRAYGLAISYTHRLFDEPLAVEADWPLGLSALEQDDYGRIAGQVGSERRTDADKSVWLVSVALPIEAATRAEAVREFWTYIDKLGPRELPAFVCPLGDELAMQPYLQGAPTNEDPEED